MNHSAAILEVLTAMQSTLNHLQVYVEPQMSCAQAVDLEGCQVKVAVTLDTLRREIETANREALANHPVI